MFFLRFWVNVFMHLRGEGAGHRLRVEQDTVMRISYRSVYTWTPIKGNCESIKKTFSVDYHFRFTRPFFVTRLNEETAFHFVFVCSFFRWFVQFVYSFVCSFICSFIRLLVRSFVNSFVLRYFCRLPIGLSRLMDGVFWTCLMKGNQSLCHRYKHHACENVSST